MTRRLLKSSIKSKISKLKWNPGFQFNSYALPVVMLFSVGLLSLSPKLTFHNLWNALFDRSATNEAVASLELTKTADVVSVPTGQNL